MVQEGHLAIFTTQLQCFLTLGGGGGMFFKSHTVAFEKLEDRMGKCTESF